MSIKKNFLIFFLGRLLIGIFSFITISVIIRLNGERAYGEYTLVNSYILLLSSVSSGWLNQGVIKYYSTFEIKEQLFETVRKVCFFISILLILPIDGILYIFGYHSLLSLFLINLIFVFSNFYSVYITELQVQYKSLQIILIECFRVVIPVFFFFLPLTLFSTFDKIFFGIALGYFIAIFIYRFKKTSISKNFYEFNILDKTTITSILNYSYPLVLWFLFATLNNITDRYVISNYFSIKEAGIYSSIYDFLNKIIILLFSPLLLILHPRMMELGTLNEKPKIFEILLKLTLAILTAIGIVSLIVILFIDKISPLLVKIIGLKIEDGILNTTQSILLPLFLGLSIWNLAIILQKPLEIANKTKKILAFAVICFFLNIATNLIFIKLWGIKAAAFTTLLSNFLYCILIAYDLKKWKKLYF